MSITFARTDTSLLSRWWWTVDRWVVAAIILLAALGIVLTMAASPAVAERLNQFDAFHFARRQAAYIPAALAIMLATSLLSPKGVLRSALIMLLVAFVATVATLFVGDQQNGATRWVYVGGISVQPSEFLKAAFAVVSAWTIAKPNRR